MNERSSFTFGIVGTGVIGAGWATRALARGWDVVAWDPAPGANARLREAVDRAWPAAQRLGLFPGADRNRITFASTLEAVAGNADHVQESAPERLELKRELLTAVDDAAPAHVPIASSTSGFRPSDLQEGIAGADRIVVGHPFNPVYLLPLVEVVGGVATGAATVKTTIDVYRDMGMHPLHIRHEVDGHLSDRLQEALWREILHLVADGTATTAELDEAIVYGPGLRWAGMGTNLTFHLAGGDGGMRHMLEQFGPALQLPWTRLEAPPLTRDLVDRMVSGTAEQAGGRSVAELQHIRDAYLLSVMRALRPFRIGAGSTLQRWEDRRYAHHAAAWRPGAHVAAPLGLFECVVEPDWVDYNEHMGESFYLLAFGWASDALFRYIGLDDDYRAAGQSFYTLESHILYYREVSVSEPLRFTTQVLAVDAKRVHLFHTMIHGESGETVSVVEQMIIHVKDGRSHPIPHDQRQALDAIAAAHDGLPVPEQVGRTIGMGR